MKNQTESNAQQIMIAANIWVTETLRLHKNNGRTLNEAETKIALEIGVANSEKIRVIETDNMPEPSVYQLSALRMQNGLRYSHTAGLTLGYFVFIKKGSMSNHLLAHELRHVYQFEQIGSLEKMIQRYLQEIMQFGYQNAPLELDAIEASESFR